MSRSGTSRVGLDAIGAGAATSVREAGAEIEHDEPPRLRGFVPLFGFCLTLPLGLVLVVTQPPGVGEVAALVFAASVTAMFGASSLFHRVRWRSAPKSRMAVLDHAMIYALIAGTYTPFALLVLHQGWRLPVLATAWGGAVVATGAKLVFRNAPAWVAAATCVCLGWIAAIIFPQIIERVGIGGSVLLAAGGLAYTIGALVYARRRPDPFPATFGYHEIFHTLVVVGVACQYATVAFFVLPRA
jgi:hemolysin III